MPIHTNHKAKERHGAPEKETLAKRTTLWERSNQGPLIIYDLTYRRRAMCKRHLLIFIHPNELCVYRKLCFEREKFGPQINRPQG